MRKAYNENNNAVLEIKPMDEIAANVTPEGIPSPQKMNYKQEEVFEKKVPEKKVPEKEVPAEVKLEEEEAEKSEPRR